MPRWFVPALAAAPFVFLVAFYVAPFATLLARAVAVDEVRDVLGRRRTWEVAWFTTWQATASTALTLVVGLAPAYVLARFRFVGRRLLLGLLTAAFVLPTVVMGAAFSALLPDSLDRSIWAILGAHVVFNLAVVVRTVGAVWEHLPPDLEAAAATLGAPHWRVFREITLPLLRPALTAAGAIVFLFTFTSFGVIRILGTAGRPTLEVEIWRRATQLGEIGPAAVLALVQLAALGVVVGWSTYSQRRHSMALAMRPLATARHVFRRRERVLVGLTSIATAAVVTIPLLALVERSMRSDAGYSLRAWRSLGDTEVRRGISVSVDPLGTLSRSVETAAWATALAVTIGAVAALAIAAAGRLGRALDTGLMLPIGTSAVTIGFGMLITFDKQPVDWRAEWWIVPVGHALVAVPFVVRVTLGVLRALDPELSHAAATLGASPLQAWREVTLTHLWRPLVAGGGLAAAISLGEFGATSFLSRSGRETMPIAIERLLGRTGTLLQAQGYALAAILAAATIAIVLVVDVTGELGGDRGRRKGTRARRL
ncbi:MAG TPA: iron ABC transporter permease [Ilumatobacteraceae bacterium]|nr:iron ABC transporter permease [Ilumatobacteraceae bacterium]